MLLPLLFSLSLANPSYAQHDSTATQSSAVVVEQPTQFSAAQRQLWRGLSLWQHTQNAAGIALDPLPQVTRGESGFSFGKPTVICARVSRGVVNISELFMQNSNSLSLLGS